MTYTFKDSSDLTNWVRYLLYVQIFVAMISIGSGFLEYQLLSDYRNGAYTSQENAIADGEASDQRQQIVASLQIVIAIISGFLILKWIYRANYNVHQLGARGLNFTPAWSIGYYFVPILSLWKPYQSMSELWKASHNPFDWVKEASGSILGIWWFLFIIYAGLGQLVFRMSLDAAELQELMNLNIIYQIYDAVLILLSVVTLYIVNSIYQKQMYWKNVPDPQSIIDSTPPLSRDLVGRNESQKEVYKSVPKNEDEIFEYIANELETNSTNKSLWYKLFAECDGDETRTKVAYINARSSQLSSEIAKAQEDLQEQERRIEMVRRAGNPVIQDKVLFRDDEVAPVPSLTVPKTYTFYKFLGILLILGGVGVVLDQGDKGNYKDVKRDGVVETYYENSQLEFKGNYKDGKQDGLQEYYDENGQLRSRDNYENGQLKFKVNFKDGQLDGLWEYYHENGQLRLRGNYTDGRRDGLEELYYENGQLRSRGNFKDGKEDGLWEWYDENGRLTKRENYKDGKLL